ncbi:AraC-like DNA-binding protein [Chitinophaga skermanii]|uniref:AraC-like DNA-binding protein n=1 Tax=Chitinophaga skermanii TaxID=331697 RepID=A0A327QWS2_9BACT|nr:helix-turn-helix domain-containing protein [Chitinophaga skermanii]RAJ08800.1 AraC-like DNA-binding protein [Chitinophaga skermanii]
MDIQFFKPLNKTLKRYISGYYFLTESDPAVQTNYLTFPRNESILSVSLHGKLSQVDGKEVYEYDEARGVMSTLICHYYRPLHIECRGRINEATIYFKPLGLNAFLEHDLADYTGPHFTTFEPYPGYLQAMEEVLQEKDVHRKIELLERYWLSKLKSFYHPFLGKMVDDLSSSDEQVSVAWLVEKYKMSRKTINKHFDIHIGKSPSEFRKIHRFREALGKRLQGKQHERLTHLSYDLNFFDQSHFIKDFKQLTGKTPKAFFQQISFDPAGEVSWLYL